MKIRSEFRGLRDPAIRGLALKCLGLRLWTLPIVVLSIPIMFTLALQEILTYCNEKCISALAAMGDPIHDKIEAHYDTARNIKFPDGPNR